MANTFFGRLRGKGAGGSAQPRVLLAAFGKHPSFDDHVPPNLEQHPRLIDLYEQIYDHGIRKLVDSGRWNELQKAGTIEPFNHLLLGRRGDEAIVGGLWASRDSVGRDKYPFVICAVCEGISLDAAIEKVLPRLRKLEQTCGVAKTREQLDAAIESTRAELKGMEQPLAAMGAAAEQAAIGALANSPQLGPDAVGLMRVMYQAEYELAGFRPGAAGTAKSRQLRVPACGADPATSAKLWLDLLFQLLDPSVPILAMVPWERNWIDLIVGTPTDEQLFVLRSGARTTPLVTDIPYPLEPAFIERCKAIIEGRTPEPAPPAAPPPPVAETARAPAPPSASLSPSAAGATPPAGSQSGKTLLVVGAAAVAAVVIGVAAYFMTRSPAPAPITSASAAAPTTPPAAPAVSRRPSSPVPPVVQSNSPPAPAPPPAVAPLPPDPRIAWTARTRIKKMQTDTAAMNDTALNASLAAADDEAQKLAALPWTARNAAAITQSQTALDAKIADLDHRLIALQNAQAEAEQRAALVAEFQNRRLNSSILQAAWDRDWSEIQSDTAASPAALRIHAQRLWTHLHGIDSDKRLAASEISFAADPPLPQLQNTLRELAAEKRAAAIKEALAPRADFNPLAENYTAYVQKLSAFNDHWQTIAELLAVGVDPAQAQNIPGAPPLSAPPAGDQELFESPRIRQALGDLPPLLARLQEIKRDSDNRLIALAGGAEQPTALRLAAWRQLGNDPRWPASLQAFRQDSAARRDILAALQSGNAPAWRQNWALATQKDLDQQERTRWRTAFIQALGNASGNDQQVAAAVKDFSDAARADNALAIPDSVMKGLTSAAPAPQVKLAGPPTAWQATQEQQGKVLSFKWRRRELRFDLLALPDGHGVYMLENEVPLGIFVDVFNELNAANAAFEIPSWRGGPCGWKTSFDMHHLELEANWWGHMAPNVAPTEDDPVQYVTPEEAMYWAALLGCRLPTLAEWTAAMRQPPGSADAAGMPKAGTPMLEGVYLPPRLAAQVRAPWTPNSSASPFAPVRGGGDSAPAFHHLLGNVAEFVYAADSPADYENFAAARPASLEAIHDYLQSHARQGAVEVIGGSAFSPPQIDPKTPYPATLQAGYADVGFRLVFPAKSPSLEKRVRDLLARF